MSEIFENLAPQVFWNQGDERTPGGARERQVIEKRTDRAGDLCEISVVMPGAPSRPDNPMKLNQ